MYKEISLTNTNFTNLNLAKVKYEPTNTCPICKSKISPVPLYSIAYDKESRTYASLLNYCNGCHSTFISNYEVGSSISSPHRIAATSYIGSEPNHYVKQEFDEKITTVSPQFEKIYNQALAAESSGLDEIAGLGYRKSLEFLIKDFAIHIYPDEADAIKNKPLSQCIKKIY